MQEGLAMAELIFQVHAWTNVRGVAASATGIAITLDGEDTKKIDVAGGFGGLSHEALAERLEDWRRKSSFHLKPSNPPGK